MMRMRKRKEKMVKDLELIGMGIEERREFKGILLKNGKIKK